MLLFNENYRRRRPARKCTFLSFLFLAGTTGPVPVLLFQSRPRPSFPSSYLKVPSTPDTSVLQKELVAHPIPPLTVPASLSPDRITRSHSQALPTIPDTNETDEDDLTADSAGVYQVEKIVRHRIRSGHPQFLIKWAGFRDSHNT